MLLLQWSTLNYYSLLLLSLSLVWEGMSDVECYLLGFICSQPCSLWYLKHAQLKKREKNNPKNYRVGTAGGQGREVPRQVRDQRVTPPKTPIFLPKRDKGISRAPEQG